MSIKEPLITDIRPENIPHELKGHKAWMVWDWVRKDNGWTKVPRARSTVQSEWTSFDEAMERAKNHSGIGYVLNPMFGIIGVDIDHCRDINTGAITPQAQEIIDGLDTYTEISPSGTGVKMWVRGELVGKWLCQYKGDDLELEVYDHSRFFTVTGHKIYDRGIKAAGAFFDHLMVKYLRPAMTRNEKPSDPSQSREIVKAALGFIDPICVYSKWVDIGMALKWLGDDCFDLWDEWSAQAGNDLYPGTEELRKKWASFPKDGKITIGTLLYHAKLAGFEVPTYGYEESDYGVARRVRDRVEDRMIFIPEWGKWLAWDGTKYKVDDDSEMQKAVIAVSKEMMSEVKIPADPEDKDAMKKYHENRRMALNYQSYRGFRNVEQMCRGLMGKSQEALNQGHEVFHCNNGTVDLTLRTYNEPSSEHYNTIASGVEYSAGADCHRWKEFIKEICCGDLELMEYLQKLCGYCLSGRVDDQSIYLLYGNGSNGKSVFTATLLRVLGEYGGTVRQELLMSSPNQHPTQFAYLHGKRCVVAQETDQDCRLNENQVKSLTGGDKIQCRRMREDFWEFSPTHKILLATNHLPNIRGTDNGIWRRVKLIPFQASFSGLQVDPALPEKLAEELSGILNWMLDGYRLYVFEGLEEPEVARKAREQYREEMSPVAQFVEDECERDPEAEVPVNDLYRAFKYYCDSCGFYTPHIRKFSQDLETLGIASVRTTHARMKKGVRLRNSELP